MTLERNQELQRQAAEGRRAAVVKPVMVEYLADIRADIVSKLEHEDISQELLQALQSQLCVMRKLEKRIDSDISNGKAAEKELREAEIDGDV